jgi:hypothetical protein
MLFFAYFTDIGWPAAIPATFTIGKKILIQFRGEFAGGSKWICLAV